MNTHRSRFRIPADHPCLPGHFPGNPIVPAVVLLEQVEHALGAALGRPVYLRGLPTVKFLSPLAPEIDCEVTLEIDASGCAAKFRCSAGSRDLAQGRLEYSA